MLPRWPVKTPAEHSASLARISSSLRAQDAISAFAGGALPHTILSSCQGTLLDMLDTRAVLPLRAACKDAAAAVAQHPWDDLSTVIQGNLGPALLQAAPGWAPGVQKGAWRACFPRARGACVSGRRAAPVVDADFAHLAGLQHLNMSYCRSVTDAAFPLLGGSLRALDMRHCRQAALTDAAFAHLQGLHSLYCDGCSQLSDAALAHLVPPGGGASTLRVLSMRSCRQFTDAGFAHLRGLRTLDMQGCYQATITDAAFEPLAGSLRSLNMSECRQAGITDAAFAHLRGCQELSMSRCHQLTSAALARLGPGLVALDISYCKQPELGDAAFEALRGSIRRLEMTGCCQDTITDAAFAHLAGIQSLDMSECSQATITDAAFVHLAGIQRLAMRKCCQAGITDAAFAPLAGSIEDLSIVLCSQVGITDAAFAHFGPSVKKLDMAECTQRVRGWRARRGGGRGRSFALAARAGSLPRPFFFPLSPAPFLHTHALADHYRRRLSAPEGRTRAELEPVHAGHHHHCRAGAPGGAQGNQAA